MTNGLMNELTLLGARVRLGEIESELSAVRAFLATQTRSTSRPRPRRAMTAADKRAISRRMKRYWRQRRKEAR